MPRIQRTGLVLCAIALLIAGCSGGGGAADNSSSPVPRGLGGPGSTQTHHHKHKANKPGKKHHHKPGPSAGSSPSGQPVHSSTPTSMNSPTRTRTSGSAPSRPRTSSSSAPHPTLPTVVVTPSTGLSAVQTVTVEGFHFKPNTLLAVAECHDRGLATGLPDCNINNVITYSPGAKVHSDANGHVGPLQITVRKTFKSVNCGTVKCLVAISEPTLQPDPSDEGDHYIHFE